MNKTSKKSVCIVGVFPPPVHGLALINEAMKNRILKLDSNASIIDLSSTSINRNFYSLFIRFIKFIRQFPKYIISSIRKKYHTIYVGLSGGFGQFYDLLFLSIARITKQNIYIHHHTFGYFNKYKLLTKMLISICGKNAIHIVLCQKMQEQLEIYKKKLKSVVLSNAVFLNINQSPIRKIKKIETIGFLGNISIEKGIDIFFKTVEKINTKRPINGLIAGPFQDHHCELLTKKRINNLPQIKYIGEILDKDKIKFFNDVDIMLFPSILEEAEPVVIHEALAFGLPVIAYNKGCISEIVNSNNGYIIDPADNFIDISFEIILKWIENPKKFNKIRNRVIQHSVKMQTKYRASLETLLKQITQNKKNHVPKS